MLELKNICFSARDEQEEDGAEKEILCDVSLELDNSFIALTGPNGGGKSTLAKVIAGIYRPQSGKVYLDGEDITDLSVTERAKKGISFAFQQPVRFKGITVRDLLRIAAGRALTREEACAYLAQVGLHADEYMDREVNASLSGGELKRVEIATILARATKVSLFDEPEAGIDLWSFNSLISVFEELHSTLNGTVLIISHQERILNIADRIIVLADGRVQKEGGREILPDLLKGTYPVTYGTK